MTILGEEIKLCFSVASEVLCQVPCMVIKMGCCFHAVLKYQSDGYQINLEHLQKGPLTFWMWKLSLALSGVQSM